MGCLFFDFAPQRPFDFGQELTQKVAQVIFLLSRNKTISSFFELINDVLSISEYVVEKH